MTDKRSFLTGGQGFIGSRLLEKLDARKEETIDIPHHQLSTFDYVDCSRFFFLSAYGNLSGQDDRYEIIRANIVSPGRIVSDIMNVEFACDLFLFTSSSSVLLPVQTPYSHAKRAAEEMILASGIPACIVRPYSCTGVGEQKQHLIPTLIRSCLEGERMPFDPHGVHDWIDVDDVVDGLLLLSDEKQIGVFELGTGIAYTNEAVKFIVEEECGKPANIESYHKMREYDYPDWRCTGNIPDRWSAQKSLPQSIKEMVSAYKKEHAV